MPYSPVQFDEAPPPQITRAPDMGEHTDDILQDELGLDWDAVVQLKIDSIIN